MDLLSTLSDIEVIEVALLEYNQWKTASNNHIYKHVHNKQNHLVNMHMHTH